MTIKTLTASALLVLAVAACSTAATQTSPNAITTGPPASTASSPNGGSSATASAAIVGTPITVKDFSLDPTDVSLRGATALAVTNAGPTVHNIAIRDGSDKVVGTTADLKAGEAETLMVDIPAGTYTMFCSLPGHESLGIKGILTVTR